MSRRSNVKLRRKVRETWLTLLKKPHPYHGWSLDMEKEVDYRFFVGSNPPPKEPESTETETTTDPGKAQDGQEEVVLDEHGEVEKD